MYVTNPLKTIALWALVLSYPVCWAQSSSQIETVRALNGQVLRLFNSMQSGESTQQLMALPDAKALIEQRQKTLIGLVDEDPRKALLVAFSPDLLQQLATSFPQLASKLETHGTWQGNLRYSVMDGVKSGTSKTLASLSVGTSQYLLNFAGAPPSRLKSCDVLTVKGLRVGDRIAVEETRAVSPTSWAECATVGAQKIAVILVNLKSSSLPSTMDPNLVTGVLLGNSGGGAQNTPDWSVDDFWQQNSDGQTWVKRSGPGAMKVVGPYTLPDDYNSNGACNLDGLRKAAYAAADNDLNYQEFTRALIIYPPNSACTWSGWATVGCWGSAECPGDGACNYAWAAVRADRMPDRELGVKLVAHELGHTLGLFHAYSRDFGTEPLGPIGTSGARQEYNDPFSNMGYWNFGFYNADSAIERLGWLELGSSTRM